MSDDCTECLICFDPVRRCEAWTCTKKCTVCADCLSSFISHHLSEKTVYNLLCPGYCGEKKCFDDFKDCEGLDPSLLEEFNVAYQLAHNPDCVLCPTCNELTSGIHNRPNLTCEHCASKFCYFHGLAHEGRPCEPTGQSLKEKVATKWWLMRKTRQCRKCKNHIEKNQGCNHMTCRCGHEICWCCGGDYVKNGRRGHSRSLFPKPRDLKYSCNDWKMWSYRVGAVTIGTPLVVGAVGLIVGLAPLAGVVVGGIKVKQSVDQAQRRREAARRHRIHLAHYNNQQARAYCERKRGEEEICLSCMGRTSCSHVFDEETHHCAQCNHYKMPEGEGRDADACVHFFGQRPSCLFCGVSASVVAVTDPGHPEFDAHLSTYLSSRREGLDLIASENADADDDTASDGWSVSSTSSSTSWSSDDEEDDEEEKDEDEDEDADGVQLSFIFDGVYDNDVTTRVVRRKKKHRLGLRHSKPLLHSNTHSNILRSIEARKTKELRQERPQSIIVEKRHRMPAAKTKRLELLRRSTSSQSLPNISTH
eukprot:m.69420 g.69420  ORF g.69420 m.69420 type:complete len:533 (+) comp11625_c0_seq1:185-1783(+)